MGIAYKFSECNKIRTSALTASDVYIDLVLGLILVKNIAYEG